MRIKRLAENQNEFDITLYNAFKNKGLVRENIKDLEFPIVELNHRLQLNDYDSLKEWSYNNVLVNNKEIIIDDQNVLLTISKRSIKKWLNQNGVNKSQYILPYVFDIIQNSKFVETHPNAKKINNIRNLTIEWENVDKNLLIHWFFAAVSIDNEILRVKCMARECRNIQNSLFQYSIELEEIEIESNPSTPTQAIEVAPSHCTSISATKLLKNVEKSKESGVKILDYVNTYYFYTSNEMANNNEVFGEITDSEQYEQISKGPYCAKLIQDFGKLKKGELIICVNPLAYKDASKKTVRRYKWYDFFKNKTGRHGSATRNKWYDFFKNGQTIKLKVPNDALFLKSLEYQPILIGDRFINEDSEFCITDIDNNIVFLRCKQVENGEYRLPLNLLFSKLYFTLKCRYIPTKRPLQSLLLMDWINEIYSRLDGTLGAIQTPDTYDDIFIRNFNSVSSAFDKEIDNELSDEELLAKYSWLPNNAKRKKLWAADTSKNLKTFLSYYFPGVKFSVSKDRYGDISVNYDDDICGFLVSGIIAKFNGKSWDGMYDEHHYHSSNFIKLFADGFSSISCYKNWDSQTERNFLNDAKDIDRLLEKYPLLIPTKDKEVYEKILKALKEALAQKSIPRHLEKYLDLRRVNPYKQRSPKTPKPSKEVVIKNPPTNADFKIVDYSEKSIVLIGDTKPYKDMLGRSGIGGTYNSHLNTDKVPGGEGWVFSKKKQQEVEDFVKKYGKSSENKDEKYLHKLFIEIICGLNNKTLSLQGIPTKGISTNPFQKNDILKLKGEMYDGTLYKVVSANTNQITTKVISGNCQTIEPFTKEYLSTLEKAKLQHLDICEEH